MKTTHEVAMEIVRLIRESLLVDDGSNKPCLGTTLNPLWVTARARNIATAIVTGYDVRPNAVAGEIAAACPKCATRDWSTPWPCSVCGADEPPPVRTPVDFDDPRIK